MSIEERLGREAARVYRRYATEVVEGLGFCPYAERSRVEGHTREVVIATEHPSDDEVIAAIEIVAADLEIEIGLLLFPRLEMERSELGRWVERLRKRHAREHQGRAVLALEGFHPDADADTSNADRLTPFVRRTPDPTIQLTRLAVLEHVRRGTPQGTAFFDPSSASLAALLDEAPRAPLHERIAERNLSIVLERGPDAVARTMDDILRDRDESYAAIDPAIVRRNRG